MTFEASDESAASITGDLPVTGPPNETGGYFLRPETASTPNERFVCEPAITIEPGNSEGAASVVEKVAAIQIEFCRLATVALGVAEISSVNTEPCVIG